MKKGFDVTLCQFNSIPSQTKAPPGCPFQYSATDIKMESDHVIHYGKLL